jgi:Uma2 family endonuclease
MPAPRRHHWFSLDEYLEYELAHDEKFEYADGAIVAMAGASPAHNIVAANTVAALHARFAGRCLVMGADQRVATADGLRTYPDALVVCGPMELSQYKGTATLHNPCLLVEVLSPSTRDYDLGEKLERYQTIPALTDVLLIETDRRDVRHVRRTLEGWETRRFTGEQDVIELVGVSVPVEAVYVGLP